MSFNRKDLVSSSTMIVDDIDALAPYQPKDHYRRRHCATSIRSTSNRARKAEQQPNSCWPSSSPSRMMTMIGTSARGERAMANNSLPTFKRAASLPSKFRNNEETTTTALLLVEDFHESYTRSFTVSGVREFNHLLLDDSLTDRSHRDGSLNGDIVDTTQASRNNINNKNQNKSAMKKKRHNPKQEQQEPQRVSFAHVEVREYNRTLGDHPGTGLLGDGPPLSLGWEYVVKSKDSVDQFEEGRGNRGGSQRQLYANVGSPVLPPLRLNHQQRRNILIWCGGYTEAEIEKATKDALKIRKQRSISQKENVAHKELLRAAGKKLKSLAFIYVSNHPYT